MIILVLNCGSSSLKYQVLDMQDNNTNTLLAKGLVERIGSNPAGITHTVTGKDKYKVEKSIANHTEGIQNVLSLLTDPELGVLKSLEDINAVGHRVAHGGEFFSKSVLVDDEAISNIEKCCALAPLHNPANLLGIRAMAELLPQVPQVAVFDTSFHQTMPDYAYMYAIPYELYEKHRIRRYGFHGTSHKYVAQKACDILGMDINNSKIITCHLGNGSSITAVHNGKSVDTSMGFTPVEGVPMGTRCGNIDAGAVTYIQQVENLNPDQVNNLLNKKSGLAGLSGGMSDCRDLVEAKDRGEYGAALAYNKLCYEIKKYIGSFIAAMNGVDLIIFTGGIGENSFEVREGILKDLDFLGIKFDNTVNYASKGVDVVLSTADSKVKVMAVTTNEELVIATDTMNIVNSK